MSYLTIHACANDEPFRNRVTACCAQEPRLAGRDPTGVMYLVVWPVSAAHDIEDAYASALAAGNPNPGGDEAVITDPMILANVQAHWPADAAP